MDPGGCLLPAYVTYGVAFAAVPRRTHALAGLLLLVAIKAQAHAHLQQAVPADGSRLGHAPTQLLLSFSEPARLVVLTIARDAGAPQQLAPLPQVADKRIMVALPVLAPGSYVIAWRVVGADGHVVPGGLHFSVTQ
jgi:methionine-rich copper-binding protein CopC